MQRSTKKLASGNIEICEGTQRWLGIKIASSVKPAMLAGWNFVAYDQGWIVDGETRSAWKPDGCIEYEGDLYVRGPYIVGTPLSKLLFQHDAFPVATLITALLRLKEIDSVPTPLHWDCIEFTEEGRLFFFPESAVLNRIKFQRDEGQALWKGQDIYQGTQAQIFCLANLLYVYYTGSYPFTLLPTSHAHDYIRKGYFVAPQLIEPRLSEEASSLISKGIQGEGTLEEFSLFLDPTAVKRTLSEEVTQQCIAAGIQYEKKLRNMLYRRKFFRTHWRKFGIALVAALALSLLGRVVVRNALTPPLTEGLSASVLVERYYESINTLDHDYIRDSTERGLARALINELMYLSVTSKIRKVYEPEFRFLDAQRWKDEGGPEVGTDTLVYGIANLTIQEYSPYRFLARYEYWRPGEQSEGPEGLAISEVLVLEKQDQGLWLITELVKKEEEFIPY